MLYLNVHMHGCIRHKQKDKSNQPLSCVLLLLTFITLFDMAKAHLLGL